ncbi:dUTP diphosphatase [Cesiribacter andamanensis]|uniref:Deoxyuridine 5'-triphosphate nucleotidohydrolase n=1 Tax=Cesiribacter andamanensis AMV16 TaxID=1279009 RepID=M7NBG3_9BACT|nr:dUTP diphosphatase [Cesiribacter andamanensis]EMR04536.1 Deoxyuridine 5'-triphosphate nucleotidohydrolase [Cesiribacter andamanensis AMV16]
MNNELAVKVINTSHHPLPAYQTPAAAGLDLRAFLAEPLELKPLQRVLIPTGLFLEIPLGFEAQVRPRSGLAYKHGVTVLNSPGTIDADYRGELKILLVNLSADPFVINDGERIAQLVVARHEAVRWEGTEALSDSSRGQGGFGSSGTR